MFRILFALLLLSNKTGTRPRSVTAFAQGRAPKVVTCEACSYRYVYLIEATESYKASEGPDSKREAAESADAGAANLVEQTLRRSVDVVPCSQCGHVQEHMVPLARKRHLLWMQTIAQGSLVLSACSIVPALCLTFAVDDGSSEVPQPAIIAWLITFSLISLGMGLLFARMKAVARYDPNSEPAESRRKSGDDQSVSLQEYEQLERARRDKFIG